MFLLAACSSGDPHDSAAAGSSAGSRAGASGNAGSSGSIGSSGSTGSSANDAAVPNPEPVAKPDYGDPKVEPDVSTDKVSDCAGAPDMTLCDVATTPDRWYDVCVAGVCVSPGCGDRNCNTPGAHFRIPPFEGHLYLEKRAGDEPVTIDKVTGLHWTSCASGMSGAGCDAGTPLELNAKDALAHCDALSWAGHDDWYLPDIYELTSIADLNATVAPMARKAFLADAAFPNQALVKAFYWSSTYFDNQFLMFSTGQNELSYPAIVSGDYAADQHPVLCVRRGFSKAMPTGERFVSHDNVPNGKPWTEDRATGLVFQGCTSMADGKCGDTMVTSADAPAHCRDLSWGDFTDWRVPTYKELLSAFDTIHATTFVPGLATQYFGKVSGPYLLVAPSGLLSTTDLARVGVGSAAKQYPVLCARGPFAP